MLDLDIQPREAKDSAASLRSNGLTPGIFYGPKEAPASIMINARKLESIWKEAGATTVITLKGVGVDKDTLIHDVQVHPVTGTVQHVDFYVLEKGKKVQLSVPLEFIGEAPAEKLGHVLIKALHEVEIEVAPSELPQHLEVDISKLENVGDHILASDVILPKSATLITNPEETIASVTAFEEYKEEEIPTEAAPATEVAAEVPGEAGAEAGEGADK